MKQIFPSVMLGTTLLCAFAAAGGPRTGSPESLSQVKTVYLLPMSSGMDQYLASQLTREGVLQVVADPSKADAILTDHLGASFEASIRELYPKAEPPKEEAAAKKDDDKDKAAEDKDHAGADDHSVKSVDQQRMSAPGRARGTIFLVKRGTWEVLWSGYRVPAVRRGKEMDRTAGQLVSALRSALKSASTPAPAGK